MNDDEISGIFQLSEQPTTDNLLHFYCFVLQKLDNPLIMNLFWETAMFEGFLLAQKNAGISLYSDQTIRDYLKAVAGYAAERNWTETYKVLFTFQKQTFEEVKRYVQKHISPAPDSEQIPFKWRIYREHPQICYSLSVRLLHEMCMGEYSEAEYLPSYEKMSVKYNVSVSTMRRTVYVLHHLRKLCISLSRQ